MNRRPVVLVADDAPDNRLIVKRFLMLGGDYRLLFATNGREALETFERQNISLVLLDMEMPVLDGFETARTIRSLPDGDAVPIIAMTAHHDTLDETTRGVVAKHAKLRVDEDAPAGVRGSKLVGRFLENQRNNATLVLELVNQRDFESVRRIGHNMKGTGKGYGFEIISSHGASLEQAASRSQADDVKRVANELAEYLAEVKWQGQGQGVVRPCR